MTSSFYSAVHPEIYVINYVTQSILLVNWESSNKDFQTFLWLMWRKLKRFSTEYIRLDLIGFLRCLLQCGSQWKQNLGLNKCSPDRVKIFDSRMSPFASTNTINGKPSHGTSTIRHKWKSTGISWKLPHFVMVVIRILELCLDLSTVKGISPCIFHTAATGGMT